MTDTGWGAAGRSGHPDRDLVLDLALGQLDAPERARVVEHLVGCGSCRTEYDELSGAVEATLAAVPRVEPAPGFDRKVLDLLGHPPRQTHGISRRLAAALAAAAAAAGVLGGAGAALVLSDDADDAGLPVVAAAGEPLLTAEGRPVGYVTRSWDGTDWSLVVNVTDGPDGARYLCRVVLADGSSVAVGDWVIDGARGNSWVVAEPEGRVSAVELVRPDERVWARVDLATSVGDGTEG